MGMLLATTKIRALVLLAALMIFELPIMAQHSGVGALSPAQLPNPAILAQFDRGWMWVGYEPSRFGLPGLNWTYGGIAVPLVEKWRGSVELWGRTAEGFSQLRTRVSAAALMTEFFAVGATVETSRYSVVGVPTRWWGTMDVGTWVRFTRALLGGIAVQNALMVGGHVEQRFGVGVGWRDRLFALGFDAVIATFRFPNTTLLLTTTPTDRASFALQVSTSPPQLQTLLCLSMYEVILELRLAF
ncbi:MAG: hypothetical protein NZ473_07860, partial [Candidatus Kapabacteria bacterium]|nr:hypothetical protein [Candidatus Kapabacteria bacterium]